MITCSFDEIFTYEEIYKAHLRGRVSKRDRRSLVRFEMFELDNLYRLYQNVHNGYRIKEYNKFLVYEPKLRGIQTLHYRDRIVQHVLCDRILTPYFTQRAVIDNCVCQIGKGMHFALERFEERLKKFARNHKQNGYVLKCDILKYFPSLSHEVLKNLICSHIKDERIRALVSHIIDSFHTRPDYLAKYGIESLGEGSKTGRGVPIGNQTSQVFGMFYLDKMDRLIKEKWRVKIYSRYMDDFVLVHEDKQFIKRLLVDIREMAKELKVNLNSKTQIFPIKNGLTYLGFRYQVTKDGKVIKKVATNTIKRFYRRANLLNKAYYDGVIGADRIIQSLTAFHGHIKHGDCFKLELRLVKRIKVPLQYLKKA